MQLMAGPDTAGGRAQRMALTIRYHKLISPFPLPPFSPSFHPQQDVHGLGFDPFAGAEEFRAQKRQRTEQHQKALQVRGARNSHCCFGQPPLLWAPCASTAAVRASPHSRSVCGWVARALGALS